MTWASYHTSCHKASLRVPIIRTFRMGCKCWPWLVYSRTLLYGFQPCYPHPALFLCIASAMTLQGYVVPHGRAPHVAAHFCLPHLCCSASLPLSPYRCWQCIFAQEAGSRRNMSYRTVLCLSSSQTAMTQHSTTLCHAGAKVDVSPARGHARTEANNWSAVLHQGGRASCRC